MKIADLFCGAGGTTQGAEQSGAARCVFAVNHWSVAVETHAANFPHATHINSRLDQVSPSESPRIDLLFASPECTHFSRARGRRPTSDQQRSGANDVLKWINYHRPEFVIVENVQEFRDWGPIDPNTEQPMERFRGVLFARWITDIQSAGYKIDHQLLNAADFGAATSRTRLFVVARKGRRAFHWPEPTHARNSGGELPGFERQPWRAAFEIIDWEIPCPSVFLRKHPLKPKTLARIEAGLRRFVEPFVVELRRNMTARNGESPLSTLTAGGGHHGVAVPMVRSTCGGGEYRAADGMPCPTIRTRNGAVLAVPCIVDTNHGEAKRSPGGRVHSTDAPLKTATAVRGQAIVVPYLTQLNGGADRRNSSLADPLRTIVAGATRHAVAVPILTTYYGTGQPLSLADSLPTITTKDRCGLAIAIIETAGSIEARTEGERKLLTTMAELGVADVGFRMLANHELAAAQGFPAKYQFAGNKSDVTRQIGNSVCPAVAEALTRSCAA